MPAEDKGLALFQEKDGVAAFELLDEKLTAVRDEGVLVENAQSKGEDDNRTFLLDEKRLKAIRTRLFLLGYLEQEEGAKGQKLRDNAYFEAVSNFQRDAGLEPDRWVGEKTWEALAQLVGFEEDTHLERWIIPQRKAVMDRALKLRLKTLGLLEEDRHRSDQENLDLSVQKFIAQYNNLFDTDIHQSLFDPHQPECYCRESLNVFFAQDKLVNRLAQISDDRLEHLKKPNWQYFLTNIAKVELWLLGYKIEPDGKIPPYMSRKEKKAWKAVLAKFAALVRLESDYNDMILDRAFFRELDLADEDVERDTQGLVDRINHEPVMAKSVWGGIKKLGNRLWDGLKRAARFVGRLLGWAWNAVKRIGEWVVSAARVIYLSAIKMYEKIKQLFQGMKYSLKLFFEQQVPGHNPPLIQIERDKDYDLRIFIDSSAPEGAVEKSLSHFSLAANLMNVTFKIMSILLHLLRQVVINILKGAGWLGLMMALVKLRPKLKALAIDLAQTISLFQELKNMEETIVNA